QQFGLSIGRFEGIEEPLARIGALTYVIDAVRLYTCGAVDNGQQPAVVSAIAKYTTTELSRQIINDGMDILGGSGICRGPRNLLANIYTATPISITVEGANILTRTLMIFGQGVIRCHPYLYEEIQALHTGDLKAFDRLFWAHLGSITRNGCRSLVLNLTRGALVRSPVQGPTATYYRKLAWASATFALLTDIALLSSGGALKRKEKLTGRFADILSWQYLAAATLRRFEAEGRPAADLPLVQWSLQYAFAQMQEGFEGIVSNLEVPGLNLLRAPLLGWLRLNSLGTLPSDRLGSKVAQSLQAPGQLRDRLTSGIYLPTSEQEALGRLEHTFSLTYGAQAVLKKIKAASQTGQLPAIKPEQLVSLAHSTNLISEEEMALIDQATLAQNDVIQVDSFTTEDYRRVGQPAL
ncbi:MAG TPA: acyl-CoA dehydrogenase domain-containing protein, partial [Leptolyngbyaceae cyanobacterium]